MQNLNTNEKLHAFTFCYVPRCSSGYSDVKSSEEKASNGYQSSIKVDPSYQAHSEEQQEEEEEKSKG